MPVPDKDSRIQALAPLLDVKENGECGWEHLLGRCPAEHAALRESVKHNGCHRITTLYLLNYTHMKVDEHDSLRIILCILSSTFKRQNMKKEDLETVMSS